MFEGRIYITKDVLFDETKFPYPHLFKNNTPVSNPIHTSHNNSFFLVPPFPSQTPSPTTNDTKQPPQHPIQSLDLTDATQNTS